MSLAWISARFSYWRKLWNGDKTSKVYFIYTLHLTWLLKSKSDQNLNSVCAMLAIRRLNKTQLARFKLFKRNLFSVLIPISMSQREKSLLQTQQNTKHDKLLLSNHWTWELCITSKIHSIFSWRHSSHIGVPKQWHSGHLGVPTHSYMRVELFPSVNTFFCCNKFSWLLAMWIKVLCYHKWILSECLGKFPLTICLLGKTLVSLCFNFRFISRECR